MSRQRVVKLSVLAKQWARQIENEEFVAFGVCAYAA